MKKSKKVLMTSDKTWIRKEEWDLQKKYTAKLEKEWMEYVLYGGGLQIKNPIQKKR